MRAPRQRTCSAQHGAKRQWAWCAASLEAGALVERHSAAWPAGDCSAASAPTRQRHATSITPPPSYPGRSRQQQVVIRQQDGGSQDALVWPHPVAQVVLQRALRGGTRTAHSPAPAEGMPPAPKLHSARQQLQFATGLPTWASARTRTGARVLKSEGAGGSSPFHTSSTSEAAMAADGHRRGWVGRQAGQHSVAGRSVGAPEGQLPRWLTTYGRVVDSRLMSAS